jgi:long-chain acyl-CoA synthetase
MTSQPSPGNSFPEIIRYHGKMQPQKIFCFEYSSGRSFNYGEFDKYVSQCCYLLKDQGIKPGDIVSSCFRNSFALIVVYFACLRLNAVINPLPSSLASDEINRFLKNVSSKLLFIEDIYGPKKQFAAGRVFLIDDGQKNFFDALARYKSDYTNNIEPKNLACLYYTSGTTRDPKCVMYSHRNMVSLVQGMTESFRFSSADIHLGILPLGHTAITNYSLLPVVYNASTLVLCDSFMKIRPDFWKIINDHRVTYVETVPTVLVMMLNTPYEQFDIKSNRSLKYIGCGSAPLATEIQKKVQDKFSLPVINLYGLSETGPTHFDDPLAPNWQPGSIGKPIAGCECVILDEAKMETANEEIGEIAIKGEQVFIGYYNNDQATQQVMHHGYFLTGDLGYKSASGLNFFVDRKKDLIIKGGVNILPGEVEEVLFQLDGVRIAVVAGVPDPIYGEEVMAFIKLKAGRSLTEEIVKNYCRQLLQPLKCPKTVIFVEDIPMGPSGKILRKELKRRWVEYGHAGR